ncbi:MAG: glycosyltransferase family 1 protein [Croceibacterium sp.]
MRLLVNGRFLTRAMTGVDRTATEITRALIAMVPQRELEIAVAVPRGAPDDRIIRERLGLSERSPIHRSVLRGYAWEQLVLARLDPGAVLLSLCNMGPVLRRNQFALIHDAQVHDTPESYTRVFGTTYRMLQPLLARRAQWLATVSRHSSERLRANGIGARRRIYLIPNGADHFDRIRPDMTMLQRLGLEPGGYLFALASPAAHKNIPLLLRAAMRREGRDLPLVLAGAGDAESLLPEGSEAGDAIRFAGRIDDNELKALYQGARLFLFPSLTEGFGFPVLEAMSCGCPVIASTGGAVPEVAGSAAMLVDPADQAAWTQAMDYLQNNSDQLGALAAAGSRQVGGFTWRHAAELVLAALEPEAGPVGEGSGCEPAIA